MNRKLISWASAMALASSVVVVPIAANAEDETTTLWSDTFNTYVNEVTHQTSPEGIGNVLVDGTATEMNTYTGIGGMTLTTTNRQDDSSYFKVTDVDGSSTDKALTTTVSRFSNAARGAFITFNDAASYTTDKDLVWASKVKVENDKGTTYDDAFSIGSTVINMDTLGIADNTWHDIKVVIKSTGSTVYVDNSATSVTSSDTSLGVIKFTGTVNGVDNSGGSGAQKSSVHPVGYPTFSFNDMVVYTAADGATAAVPTPTDNTPATPPPTDKPAAELTDTTVFDFETDDTSFVPTVQNGTGEVVEDSTIGKTHMMKYVINGKDESASKGGYSLFDISSYTEGKSHIQISYDAYIIDDGRLKYAIRSTSELSSKLTETPFIFAIGKTGGSGLSNCAAGWNHVVFDVNLETGKGTWKVTPTSGTEMSGTVNDVTAVTNFDVFSWAGTDTTTYLDNLTIKTGGTLDPVEVPTVSPEPAASAEGSNIDLLPLEGVTGNFDFSSLASTTTEKILNHSEAKAAAASGSASVYDENTNVRGKSVFASFDLLVNAGNTYTIAENGNSNALGAQVRFIGNEDGTLTIQGIGDKGDTTAIGSAVCGTWYRVTLEIPQVNNNGVTNTGNTTVTVSRIDSKDCSKTTGVVASGTVTPRNLSAKGITTLSTTVEGEGSGVYVDNGVIYVRTTAANTWWRYHFTKDANGIAVVSDVEYIDDPASKSDKIGKEYYIWNELMQPYVPTTDDGTTDGGTTDGGTTDGGTTDGGTTDGGTTTE